MDSSKSASTCGSRSIFLTPHPVVEVHQLLLPGLLLLHPFTISARISFRRALPLAFFVCCCSGRSLSSAPRFLLALLPLPLPLPTPPSLRSSFSSFFSSIS